MSIVVNAYELTLYISAYINKPHCSSSSTVPYYVFVFKYWSIMFFFILGEITIWET